MKTKIKFIDTIEEMKELKQYKIYRGKKGELRTFDEAEIAIYQISLDLLLLRDFLRNHGIGHKNQSFVNLGENLGELYNSIAKHRCDCFKADTFMRSMGLDKDWIN